MNNARKDGEGQSGQLSLHSPLDVLTLAAATLSSPEHWTQNALARNRCGEEVGVEDTSACAFSPIGAIGKTLTALAAAEGEDLGWDEMREECGTGEKELICLDGGEAIWLLGRVLKLKPMGKLLYPSRMEMGVDDHDLVMERAGQIEAWNNCPQRTCEEVRATFQRALDLAKKWEEEDGDKWEEKVRVEILSRLSGHDFPHQAEVEIPPFIPVKGSNRTPPSKRALARRRRKR